MTYWAYVENDQNVIEYSNLPRVWNNISNFHALENNRKYLKQLDWYELVDDTVPISNSFLQYHDAPQYTVDHEAGLVRKNCPIIERDSGNEPEHQAESESRRDIFFAALRQERRVRLLESDWTQTVDLQSIRSEQWKAAWASYRQQLRDLPQTYEHVDIDDIGQVDWPQIPETD